MAHRRNHLDKDIETELIFDTDSYEYVEDRTRMKIIMMKNNNHHHHHYNENRL
jgi:hypothetical protein